jgi:hypothetical protein
LTGLRSENQQIVVDKRMLADTPLRDLPTAKIAPDVPFPDWLSISCVKAIQIPEGTTGIDMIPLDGRNGARAGITGITRSGVLERP